MLRPQAGSEKTVLPGPEEIIECPYCQTHHKLQSWASGNTLGAVLWTDGYLGAPMLPNVPFIARCLSCEAFVFIEDMRVVGEVPRVTFSKLGSAQAAKTDAERRALDQRAAWKVLPLVRELEWSSYVEAIRQLDGSVTPNRLRRLRIALWHLMNDLRREHPPGPRDRTDANGRRIYGPEEAFAGIYPPRPFTPEEQGIFETNLTKLLELADVEPALTASLRCEALRELGRFEEAVCQLRQAHLSNKEAGLAERILDLSVKRNAEPAPL